MTYEEERAMYYYSPTSDGFTQQQVKNFIAIIRWALACYNARMPHPNRFGAGIIIGKQ